jgi:hypothetical protein
MKEDCSREEKIIADMDSFDQARVGGRYHSRAEKDGSDQSIAENRCRADQQRDDPTRAEKQIGEARSKPQKKGGRSVQRSEQFKEIRA